MSSRYEENDEVGYLVDADDEGLLDEEVHFWGEIDDPSKPLIEESELCCGDPSDCNKDCC